MRKKTEITFWVERDSKGKFAIMSERGGTAGLDAKAIDAVVTKLKKAGKKVRNWPWKDK